MRKLALLLIVISPSVFAQTCSSTNMGGSFVCVGFQTSFNSAATTPVAFAGGHTGGDYLIAVGEANSASTFSSTPSGNISNTAGYTWQLGHANCTDNAGIKQLVVYYAVVPTTTAVSDTITLTNSGATFITLNVIEASGVGALDGSGACANGSSAVPASGTYTVTNGDLLIGGAIGASDSVTAGSGFASRSQDSLGPYTMLESKLASGTSANATFGAASASWAAIGIAFKAAGGGGGGNCAACDIS